jgi:hypothetical protein
LAPTRPDKPNAGERTFEERLAALEAQMQAITDEMAMIRRHLDLLMRHPVGPSKPASKAGNTPTTTQEQLQQLENAARETGDRLEQIERQLEKAKTPQPLTNPPIAPIPMQGRLVVRNWTTTSHHLSVNGALYLVQPGRTDIPVPYQQVEAYMPGHELPKVLGMSFWRWTGRDYEMWMDVKN